MNSGELAGITGQLLETCRDLIKRYFVLSDEQAVILSAWLLHTYVFDSADLTPYIHITAAEKECGKTNLMDLLAALAAKPEVSSGTTPAALVRIVHAARPTIFLDEMDALLKGNKEGAESIRGILNAGFRRGGKFRKCNVNTHEIEEFNAYCPKCLTGIGELWGTVASRSIAIVMKRKRREEIVEPFRQRAVNEAGAPIRKNLQAWAALGVSNVLQNIRPASIASLSDRQNDIAEPLLAIAQLAGDEWLHRLTGALSAVLGAVRAEDGSVGATMLSDIRAAFDELVADEIPSAKVLAYLCRIEGREWADWNHGKGVTANNLARQLKKYNIYPRTIRVGKQTPKGYRRADFEDAWSRYCPLPRIPSATTPQPASLLAETAFSNRNTQPYVADAKNALNPHEYRGVADVAAAERDISPADHNAYFEGSI